MNIKFETDVNLVLQIRKSVNDIARMAGNYENSEIRAAIDEKLEKIRLQLREELIDPFIEFAETFSKSAAGDKAERKLPRIGGPGSKIPETFKPVNVLPVAKPGKGQAGGLGRILPKGSIIPGPKCADD